MSDEAYEYKDHGLKLLKKILIDNASRVKVGIPSDNDNRISEGLLLTQPKIKKNSMKNMLVKKNIWKMKRITKKNFVDLLVGSMEAGMSQSNATIGMKHEFGIDVPQRSFLRMPLTEQMQKYVNNKNAFDKEALLKVVKDKSIVPWLKKLGIIAENIVGDAFHTRGFGKWPVSAMFRKTNHQTLVETTQLRESITSIVEEKT